MHFTSISIFLPLYLKMASKKMGWGWLVGCLFALNAAAQFEPISIPKSNFYTTLYRHTEQAPSLTWMGTGRIFNSEIHGLHSSRFTQELLLSNGKLYMFLGATGRIYEISNAQKDDSVRMVRLDTTSLTGYNINSYAFSLGDSIFNIGGYGFWRWNGHLRLFNSSLKEWDVVPLNKELPLGMHSPNAFLWNDKQNHTLYALNYFVGNDGVRVDKNKKFDYVDSVNRLDVQTGDWKNLGKINPRFEKDRAHFQIVAELDSGLLLDNSGLLEYWNLLSNSVSMFESIPKRQQISTKTIHCYLWYVAPYLYYGSPATGRVDSISITHTDFRPLHEPVYVTPAPGKWWMLFILLIAGSLFAWFIRRKNQLVVQSIAPSSDTVQIIRSPLRSPQTKSQLFDEVEQSLLALLLRNMNEKESRTETDEVNRVLGVAGSTLNMQKRKRSDVIRSINTKYSTRYPDRQHPLINRMKSELDARLFEYFVSPQEVNHLTTLLTRPNS